MQEELWKNFNDILDKKTLKTLGIHKEQDINAAVCSVCHYVDRLHDDIDRLEQELIGPDLN